MSSPTDSRSSQPTPPIPLKVFFLCSGLGRTNRGYESFTRECFDALADCPELDLLLFKGGGASSKREKVLWSLPRVSKTAQFLGSITRKESYFVEQVSFFLALIPRIARQRPHVIYFSDGNIGNLLWHWRRLTKQKYRLLLSNGAPYLPPFIRSDHVQQVAVPHYQKALEAGESASKHSLIPYGINVEEQLTGLGVTPEEKGRVREQLGLPPERPIILSVAAINKSHKRVDYLISEVARLPEPRPFLLMLGQQEEETPAIKELALELLGQENFAIKTVKSQEIDKYYRVSDLFVLASLGEGFGRVFLEAMSRGLLCLAHDYPVTRYVLGSHGFFADFKQTGSLAALIQQALPQSADEAMKKARHSDVYQRFSWEHLRANYVELLRHAAVSEM